MCDSKKLCTGVIPGAGIERRPQRPTWMAAGSGVAREQTPQPSFTAPASAPEPNGAHEIAVAADEAERATQATKLPRARIRVGMTEAHRSLRRLAPQTGFSSSARMEKCSSAKLLRSRSHSDGTELEGSRRLPHTFPQSTVANFVLAPVNPQRRYFPREPVMQRLFAT
jgi:hypothetical protein